MKFQHLFVAAITAVFLSGCATEPSLPPVSRSVPNADQRAKIVRGVLEGLKDSDSAKFGEITIVDGIGACATVNAKNALGGYNGYQQAIVKDWGVTGWMLAGILDTNHELCIDALHDTLYRQGSLGK